MRTKTVLLSALLGTLGSVAVNAQNVYSLNAVGYINVTCYPGFNIISCPLQCVDTNGNPNNTVGNLLNNATGSLTGTTLDFFSPLSGPSFDTAENHTGKPSTANANGWVNNGTNVLSPGVACWFQNNSSPASNIVITFVGTVPSGPWTNSLYYGYNLVSSVVPASGDVVTNSLMNLTNYNLFDTVYTYNPAATPVNETYQSGSGKGFGGNGYNQSTGAFGATGNWSPTGDPVLPTVGGGFFYENNGGASSNPALTVQWVENYSVSQ
jgi:hypothetical protein